MPNPSGKVGGDARAAPAYKAPKTKRLTPLLVDTEGPTKPMDSRWPAQEPSNRFDHSSTLPLGSLGPDPATDEWMAGFVTGAGVVMAGVGLVFWLFKSNKGN